MIAATGNQPSAGALDITRVPAARRAVQVSSGFWAVLVLAAFAGAALAIVARGDLKATDLIASLGSAVAVVAYATLGTLIVRRAGNLIGWLMLGESAAMAFLGLASMYAVLGVATFPGALPATKHAGTLAQVSFTGVTFILAFMFLLFPAGKLPSRRWRPLAAAGFLLAGLTAVGLVLRPRLVRLPAPGGTSLSFPNPFGMAHFPPLLRAVPIGTLDGLFVTFAAFLAAAFVSLAARYRAGDRLLRQQVKWLALVAAMFVACQLIAVLVVLLGEPWLDGVADTLVAIIALFGIPAAMAIAILRDRLYDIDIIISRTVAYVLLSAVFTIVYAGIVLGLGTFAGHRGGPLLTIATAICIAVLFQPLRHRFQRFANRLVYGERATPYQVLADFAENMAGQLDFAEAVERMVSVLGAAAGADRSDAWIRVGSQLRPVAVWPRQAVQPPAVPLDPNGAFPTVGIRITCGACPPLRRTTRSPVLAQAAERGADQRRRQAATAPSRTSRPRAAQRAAHRRPAGHH